MTFIWKPTEYLLCSVSYIRQYQIMRMVVKWLNADFPEINSVWPWVTANITGLGTLSGI